MRKGKGKRIFAAILAAALTFTSGGMLVPADAQASREEDAKTGTGEENGLRLWYDKPAPVESSDSRWWQSEGLPLGNGSIGGLVFGGVTKDRIHFNEKTLWTGGPRNGTENGADGNPYRGGNRLNYAGDDALQNLRDRLDDKTNNVFGLEFSEGNNLLTGNFFSHRYDKGQYMDFGDVWMDFSRSGILEENATDYVRDLDMNTAVSSVQFVYDGDTYKREMFVSYPDNVLVCQLTSSGSGKMTLDVSLEGMMNGSKNITASGNRITLKGSLNDNGMKYESHMAVLNEGGALRAEGSKILVDGADSVTLIMSAATNYKNEYPTYRSTEELSLKAEKDVEEAVQLGYGKLKQRHLEDYQELFSRVTLDLHSQVPRIPTDELVVNYRNGQTDPALETMIYQYGRYLTIAGSREGGLPSNLCGVWLVGDSNALWQGDYHFNINLQMNYWPVYSTNLAECGTPMNDYMESLVVPGRYSAAMAFGTKPDEQAPVGEGNGFLIHTVSNPFGGSAPAGSQEYGWNPNGGTWALQNVYDYYRFTMDQETLRSKIYPMMKEEADFWAEQLWYSPNQERLTVAPSVSAEQGPTVVGSTYDQSLVWQLFEEAAQAAEILGVDEDRAAVWKEKQAQLDPILISDAGYIKEWYEETTPGKAQDGKLPEISVPNYNAGYNEVHRHSSHLIGLYPGSLINKDNKEYIKAAEKSLIQREFAGTGWSKAHRINLWARVQNGNNAYRLVKGMLQGGNAGILTNLLDSHGNGANHKEYPVFQIDGNYGITAGMTEMLLQSQLGYVQFLPALPDAWPEGSVEGLVARGNFEVDMSWKNRKAYEIQVTSRSGGVFTGEYEGIGNAEILDANGQEVQAERISEDQVAFQTRQGETYRFLMTDKAPAFSAEEGMVPAGTEIEIQSPDENLQIRYTMDGSAPDASSLLYVEPLRLEAGQMMELTAALYQGKKRVGNVARAEYRNNLALTAAASSESSSYNGWIQFTAEAARDGKKAPQNSSLGNGAWESRWAPRDGDPENWITFDFGKPVTVSSTVVEQYKDSNGKNHIDGFQILYSEDGEQWKTAGTVQEPEWEVAYTSGDGSYSSQEAAAEFSPVKGRYMKLLVTEGTNPSVWEWELYEQIDADGPEKEELRQTIYVLQEAFERGLPERLEASRKNAVENALYEANVIRNQWGASRDEINTVQQKLQTEMEQNGLVYGDTKALEDAVRSAKQMDLTQYQEGTRPAFLEAVKGAETLLNGEPQFVLELSEALQLLQRTKQALQKKQPGGTGDSGGSSQGGADQGKLQSLGKPAVKSVKSVLSTTGPCVKITVSRSVENADMYQVYRISGKKATRIGTADRKGVIYDKKPLTNHKKAGYYAIAESSGGKYRASAPGKAKYITLPKAPSKVTLKKKGKTVRINWKRVSGAKAYVIYRSEKKNGKYRKVAVVKKGLTCLDKKVKKKKTYYYAVTAKGAGGKYSGLKISSKIKL